nr:hypothetical protein [Candidatus Sigynarchaeota archaeon]
FANLRFAHENEKKYTDATRNLVSMAQIYADHGYLDDALKHYQEALECCEKIVQKSQRNMEKCEIFLLMSKVYSKQQDMDRREEYNKKAMALIDEEDKDGE